MTSKTARVSEGWFGEILSERWPTLAEVLQFLSEQQLQLRWRDGRPCLHGPREHPLRELIAKFLSREPLRSEIVSYLQQQQAQPEARLREFRYRNGSTWCYAGEGWPSGALWWRWYGEEQWHDVPEHPNKHPSAAPEGWLEETLQRLEAADDVVSPGT